MKLNKKEHIVLDSNTSFEGYEASIDEKNMHKLWDLLQDPYKNPIGAVVREYVSNSFDSHAEALFIKNNSISEIKNEYPSYMDHSDKEINSLKDSLKDFNNEAVVVAISKDESGHYWSTEDFGVGLSESRVKNIFASYLTSTKENSNNVIGAFGIGSKSGLSYTDAIHIRTRYNGEESLYILRKGNPNPRLDKIVTIPTEEKNGTLIKIYIKKVKKYDWQSNAEPEIYRFIEECKNQLAYFNNVYFSDKVSIDNDFKLLQGRNWVVNTYHKPFSKLHLCLGKVAYPIDWDNLGVSPIDSPVALKFEIGELDIIQTREDVKYTPRTKKAIIEKIEAFKQEIRDKWNEIYNDGVIDNFTEYLQKRNFYYDVTFGTDYTYTFSLKNIFTDEEVKNEFSINYSEFEKIKYKDAHKIPDRDFFRFFYIPSYVNSSGLKHTRTYEVWRCLKESSKNELKYDIYRIEGNHEPKKSKYLVHLNTYSQILLLRKEKQNLKYYLNNCYLSFYSKDSWRSIISAIQKAVLSTILENTKSYSKTEIDPVWLLNQRKARKNKDISTFTAYVHRAFNNRNFVSEKFKKSFSIGNSPRLKVIGIKNIHDDSLTDISYYFRKIYGSDMDRKTYYLTIAKSNVKYVENSKNLLTVENFKTNKAFIKSCTIHYLITTSEEYSFVSKLKNKTLFNTNSNLMQIFPNMKDKLESINKYINTFYLVGFASKSVFFKSCYDYVLEEDLLDKEFIKEIEDIYYFFKDLPILEYINSETPLEILASYIYRFNKSVPINKHKKMKPMYYVNLNEAEKSWLSEEELNKYKIVKLID